ncbi:MAG: ribonuclease activity regulator RraA [Gemmatimonadetes bacterium]|nr:ribonuclease activity regulator RraA [Gemmatimonadota bacterium]
MVDTSDIQRPAKELVEGLSGIGSATAAGELARLGIRDPYIQGPVARTPGKSIVGPALTLQFMPKREDQYAVDEYADPEKQLHRHALYHTQPGDIIVVDARANMNSGVFGDMMMTFFMGQGGIGAIIDGCIRDYPKIVNDLDIGLWLRGTTPNFHTQTNIVPFAVNVPIACGDTLVMPGDIIVADDDGATVVPVSLAPELVEKAQTHAEWEEFSRMKLSQGGHLRKYYPLSEEGRAEYEAWKKEQGH